MDKVLLAKVHIATDRIRRVWEKLETSHRFIAFSTGKDSLAMTALIYEALEHENPVCLYSHHNLEFPGNLEYLEVLRAKGFNIKIGHPFLEYFELMERGIGFLTLVNAWCIPLLIGTTFLEWLRGDGAHSPKEAIMFRGISGTEYSHSFHNYLELNKAIDIPCFYPMLDFSKQEILELLKNRYGLPLNPIYKFMDRTYCLCCYTSDAKRQSYCQRQYPHEYSKYYRQIEEMIFDSGLIEKSRDNSKFKTREEKLFRHGFAHWHRLRAQNAPGAVKRRLHAGALVYHVRNSDWIKTKHLVPVKGRWTREKNEIRFWDLPERIADCLVKRMINCLNCGFCMVECFQSRRFDRESKSLVIENCSQCGHCLSLKNCIGWRHRFWRRIIVNEDMIRKEIRREKS